MADDLAAAGGVGHLAVQMASRLGAHVIATASSRNFGFVRSLGAETIIDYTSEDFVAPCLEATGGYDDALLEHLRLWVCALEKTTALQRVKPEHHRKDDRFDADLLAEYGYRYSDKLQLYQAPDPVIEQIRLLYRERRRLVTQRGAVLQLRAEQGYNRAGAPNAAAALGWLG